MWWGRDRKILSFALNSGFRERGKRNFLRWEGVVVVVVVVWTVIFALGS